MKREYRHLWIIQQMISFMKSTLKIMQKIKKAFFIKEGIFLFFRQENIFFIQNLWHSPAAKANFECCSESDGYPLKLPKFAILGLHCLA